MVDGFETLVEPPRTGELYLRDGWEQVGVTEGLQATRVSGKESKSSWGGGRTTGRRVWLYDEPRRPKIVLCRWAYDRP